MLLGLSLLLLFQAKIFSSSIIFWIYVLSVRNLTTRNGRWREGKLCWRSRAQAKAIRQVSVRFCMCPGSPAWTLSLAKHKAANITSSRSMRLYYILISLVQVESHIIFMCLVLQLRFCPLLAQGCKHQALSSPLSAKVTISVLPLETQNLKFLITLVSGLNVKINNVD